MKDIEVKFDKAKLNRVRELLRDIPKAMPKVMSRAVNRTATSARAEITRRISDKIALKKGIYIYSSSEEISCSGRNPKYPVKLLSEIFRISGYSLRKSKGDYQCEHMAENEGQSLNIQIKSIDQSVKLCKSCTSRKANLYTELTGRVLAKNPGADINIILEHDLKCKSDKCSISSSNIKNINIPA